MSDMIIKTTSSPTKDDLESFLNLLSTSFQTVPLTTAFITEIDGVAPSSTPQTLSPSRLKQHFSLGLPAAFRSNILLTSASSSSQTPLASVLFEPPDFSGTPPAQARKQPGPILSQYRSVARGFKSKHLAVPESGPHSYDTPAAPSQSSSGPSGDPYPNEFNKDVGVEIRRFYHLAFLVKNTDADEAETQAAVKAVMEPYLKKAKEEDVPIFLEASSPQSKAEFESFGFNVVEEVTVGAGKVDSNGWPKDDGEGVKVWGMIYNA